jgi:hypothetical protein
MRMRACSSERCRVTRSREFGVGRDPAERPQFPEHDASSTMTWTPKVAPLLMGCLFAVTLAGCGAGVNGPSRSPSLGTPPRGVLPIGRTASLNIGGARSGERVEATVLAYKAHLAVGKEDSVASGMKFVGVTLRLTNVGTIPYTDAPFNGAMIVTATGLEGRSVVIVSGECSEGFASEVVITPGESREGCILFELPDELAAAKFQWTPSSGYGEETAQWLVGRSRW